MRWRCLLLGFLISTIATAQPVVWNIAVPPTWVSVPTSNSDESLIMQLHPKDPARTASVVVRRYPQQLPSLADELQQLRYSVVMKLEGQIIKSESCSVAGLPGWRVVYEGRTDNGDFKKFVRYIAIFRDELLTVHCVVSPKPEADHADFKSIVDGIQPSVAADTPE